MWPFKKKSKVLDKPVYRFRDGRLVYAVLPAGRTERQVAIWRQEVACVEIECNGSGSAFGSAFGVGLGLGNVNYFRDTL